MTTDSAEASVSRPQPSERFERATTGRLLISSVVILILAAEVITHLPRSEIDDRLGDPAAQLVRVFAGEQDWGVFAPDPRPTSVRLEAHVTFADGSTTIWRVPEGSPVGANLRYYRWRKWFTRIRLDSYAELWRPTAEWIASLYEGNPSEVVRVELVRRFRDNVVAGEQPPFEDFAFYTLDLS